VNIVTKGAGQDLKVGRKPTLVKTLLVKPDLTFLLDFTFLSALCFRLKGLHTSKIKNASNVSKQREYWLKSSQSEMKKENYFLP
jgi:hypothetical protein